MIMFTCICLRGIFKKNYYKHPSGKIININSEKCVENIKKTLISKFENPYIVCIVGIDDDINSVINSYKPNKIKIESGKFLTVYSKIATFNIYLMHLVLELEYENKIKFDKIFVTRYDIYIDEKINFLSLIKDNKYNTLCKAEKDSLVDDIFCCFNSNFIHRYILTNQDFIDRNVFTHELSIYNNNIGEKNIHFMFSGNYLLFEKRPLIKFFREF